MDNIEAKAYLMPERYKLGGKVKAPVVVMLDQGASPTGRNDEALAPVGAGALHAGGAEKDVANVINQPGAREARRDDKKHPVRMFHLVDASPSMSEFSGAGSYCPSNTKLKLVQDTITRLADHLPDGIKHVLIPYSDQLHLMEAGSFNQPTALVEAIKELTTRGGTDIGIPIAEALRRIQEKPNTKEGIEYRNLVNLISDGQAEVSVPLNLAKTYPQHNAAAFSLGVGPHYNEALMHGVVENAGFGGFAHIPQTGKQQVIDVFGKILPEFVSQMMSAPYYPVIKLNKWFDSVVNMTPATRVVGIDEKPEPINGPWDCFKYRAAIGYQNRGFVVGFVDADKLDQARVDLEINESASKKPLETQELEIQDFDTLGLDLQDIELLRKAPLEALKMQIIKERDPAKIQQFLADNTDLDPGFKQLLDELAKQLRTYARAGDDNASMTVTGGDQSFSFVSQSMGFGDLDQPPISPDANTIGAANGAYTLADNPNIRTIEQAPAVDDAQASKPGMITLKFTPIKTQALMVKNGAACDEFTIAPDEQLIFGRSLKNNIIITGEPNISRTHGSFELKDGDLYVIDQGSKNGIQINDGEYIKPHEAVIVRPEDIIHIADETFRVSYPKS